MCFPFLAALPAAIGSAASAAAGAVSSIGFGTAASLAGTALSAAGSIAGGAGAASQQKAQAAEYDRQARISLDQGAYEAGRKQDEIDGTLGQQVALTHSAGFTLDGSPAAAMASTASSGALDVAMIRRNARLQADQYRYQAQLSRANARSSLTGGIIGGGASLFSGLTKLGNAFGERKPGSV